MMKILFRPYKSRYLASFEKTRRLLIQRIAPLADEIHDGEGNRQNAQESYEEFEEIPVEGVDHIVKYYITEKSSHIYELLPKSRVVSGPGVTTEWQFSAGHSE
jgi:hypothetical protein